MADICIDPNNILKYLIAFIVGIFIGLMINIPSCSKQENIIVKVPVHDTITVDSIRIQEHTVINNIKRIDTFYIRQKEYVDKVNTIYKTDTILNEADTIFLIGMPIEYKTYSDTIKTDTTSTEIDITYHGFDANIDNIYLKHNYYNKTEIIPETKKRLTPFIFAEGGPIITSKFTGMKGAQLGVGAGVYINDSWGVGASYDVNLQEDITHNINLQIYKKF